MKKKYKLLFRYDIDNYQAGSIHELELTEVELGRLTRRGCIFAPEDAELTKEDKVETKPEEVKEEKPKKKVSKKASKKQTKKELDNVDNKEPASETKVQADSTDKE